MSNDPPIDLIDADGLLEKHVNHLLVDSHNITIAAMLGERVTLSQTQVSRIALALNDYLESCFLVCPIRHDICDIDEDEEKPNV